MQFNEQPNFSEPNAELYGNFGKVCGSVKLIAWVLVFSIFIKTQNLAHMAKTQNLAHIAKTQNLAHIAKSKTQNLAHVAKTQNLALYSLHYLARVFFC